MNRSRTASILSSGHASKWSSLHASFGAAAFVVTRLSRGTAAGDREAGELFKVLSFVSEEVSGANHDYEGTVRPKDRCDCPKGLGRMIEENGEWRVFLGVHWIFDASAWCATDRPDFSQNISGVPLGPNIAESIFLALDPVNPRLPLQQVHPLP